MNGPPSRPLFHSNYYSCSALDTTVSVAKLICKETESCLISSCILELAGNQQISFYIRIKVACHSCITFETHEKQGTQDIPLLMTGLCGFFSHAALISLQTQQNCYTMFCSKTAVNGISGNVPKFSQSASHPPPQEISALLSLTYSFPDFCYVEETTIQVST